MKKPYIEIIFKSSAVVTFEATKLTTKHSPATGLLTEMAWEGAVNGPQYLQLSEIDCARFVQP